MDAGAWVYPLVSTATDPLSQTTAGVVGVPNRNLPTGKLFPRSPPSPLRHDRTVLVTRHIRFRRIRVGSAGSLERAATLSEPAHTNVG
jgi:hypothetical protein